MPKHGEFVTPLPAYSPHPTSMHASAARDSRPKRQKRSAKQIVAACFAVTSIAGLTVGMTLPSLSSAETLASLAPGANVQHLRSANAMSGTNALDAIGAVDVGVDMTQFKQFGSEAGLVEPSSLSDTKIRLPFDREWPLTDGFAYRTAPVEQFHDAQDIAAADGTPVLAIGDGVVIEAGYASDGCGFSAKLQHRVEGETLTSRYCHMQVGSHDLKVGDEIEMGQQIGRVGNTGMSFGSHLHLALRLSGVPIDPLPYIDNKSVFTISPDK